MLLSLLNVLDVLLVLALTQAASNNPEEISILLDDIINSLAKIGYAEQGYANYAEPYIGQSERYTVRPSYQNVNNGYVQSRSYSEASRYALTPRHNSTTIGQYASPPVYASPPLSVPAPSNSLARRYLPTSVNYPEGETASYRWQHRFQKESHDDMPTIVRTKYVYIPVVVKRKKKKMKIISVHKGFFIPGGTQLFGKYKSLKACEKACAATPNCFAGDFNPWFKKCYIHSNYTACGTMKAHKKLIHFKKVPCGSVLASSSRIMLGVQIFKGLEQTGIKSLSDCVKKCMSLGIGIPSGPEDLSKQLCFGVDYDFGKHKCYFHVNNAYPPEHLCPHDGSPPPVSRDTVPNPSVVSILLCGRGCCN